MWPTLAQALHDENEALTGLVDGTVRPHLAAVRALTPEAESPRLAQALAGDVRQLWAVSLHFRLKEELVLPWLADHGSADARAEEEADDQARTCLGMARSLVEGAQGHPTASNLASAADQVEEACEAMARVTTDENERLLPLAVEVLSIEEWSLVEVDRTRYPTSQEDGASLWPSPVERMDAAVRHAMEAGRLPGARL